MRHAVEDLFLAFEKAFGRHVLEDHAPRFIPVETLVFFRYFRNDFHGGMRRHQVDERQVMTPANLEIVEIMCRRDLHRTRTLFRIRVFIGNDRDRPVRQRQDRHPADKMLIAFIVRMDSHGTVAKHRLGTGRGDGDIFVLRSLEPVFQMPHRAFLLALLHLKIGNRRQQLGIPVDQPLVPVDQAVAVHLDENLHDGT